jgi:hypothetical protein
MCRLAMAESKGAVVRGYGPFISYGDKLWYTTNYRSTANGDLTIDGKLVVHNGLPTALIDALTDAEQTAKQWTALVSLSKKTFYLAIRFVRGLASCMRLRNS